MATPKLKVTVLALLTLAGCSQILGLNDYEIDPSLDPAAGGDGNEGGDTSNAGSGGSAAGSDNQAGEAGRGGDPGTAGMGGDAGAAGAGNGPTVIPCDSTDCCDEAGGVVDAAELLLNGDFETGRAAWGMSSQNGYDIFTKQTDSSIPANSGTWYAWIGGNQNDIGVLLSPAFEIPADTGWLGIEGYRLLAFDSLKLTGDYARVDLFDADGDFMTPEEPFFYWDNDEYSTDQWQLFAFEVPMGEYTGQKHHISIVGVTDDKWDVDAQDPDDQLASNFFFDDLSFKAFKCVAP